MASCQKLGIILAINGFKNWLYQKMSITTNVLLNWYSSMKKNQKHSDDFWHRKLTLKVKFWYFLTAPHYSNFQNLVISFEYSWFLAKNLSNFVSLPWKLHNRECHTIHPLVLLPLMVDWGSLQYLMYVEQCRRRRHRHALSLPPRSMRCAAATAAA